MDCGAAQHALCDFISAVSECDVAGNLFVHLADAADRGAILEALDALALLEAGQSAGDARRWHVCVLRLGVTSAPPPPWWPTAQSGRLVHREFLINGRVQRVALRVLAS